MTVLHCKQAVKVLVFFSLLLTFLLRSAHADAAVSCESMALDPQTPEGVRILQRYYQRNASGVGGLGCWVHPHPIGKDFLITPYSWGQNPDSGMQRVLNDAFQAITDSRNKLETLGTLNVPLYILLNDIMGEDGRAPAEAQWFINNQCWIEAGPGIGFRGGTRAARNLSRSVLAHEIGHCFLMENIPGYTPASSGISHWWDESGAEFLMGFVYPQDNIEHHTAVTFDMDGKTFVQAYDANVLLQHYANRHGNDEIIPLLTRFHTHSANAQQFKDFLDSADLDDFYDDFSAMHFKSSVSDSGGGNVPAETEIIPFDTVRLKRDEGDIHIASVVPYRLNVLQLTLPEGFDVTLYRPDDGNDRYRATVSASGATRRDWAKGTRIPGNCHDELVFDVLFTSLSKGGVSNLNFNYRRTEATACRCEDEPPLDACLVGKWHMTDQSVAEFISGKDKGSVSGSVEVTFAENGAFMKVFSGTRWHDIYYTTRGEYKGKTTKEYRGVIRGCATTIASGRRTGGKRSDNAIPIRTEGIEDSVNSTITIAHASRNTTTKRNTGLEKWHWPNTPAYYRCDNNTLFMGRREYIRVE